MHDCILRVYIHRTLRNDLPSHLSFRPPLSIPWIPFAITVDIVKTQRQRCPRLVESRRDRLPSIHSLVFLIISFFSLSLLCRDRNEGQHLLVCRNARATREIFVSSFPLLFILDFVLYRLFRRGSLVIDRSFRQIDDTSRNILSNLSAFVIEDTSFGFYFHLFVLLFINILDIFIARFSRGTGGTSYGSFASFATAKMKVELKVYGHV